MTQRTLTSHEIVQLTKIVNVLQLDEHLKNLDVDEAVELIYKLHLDTDIEPFIGKTNSIRLLQLAVKKNDVHLVGKCLYVPIIKEYKYDYDVFRQALDIGNSKILTLLLERVMNPTLLNFTKLSQLSLTFLKEYYKLYPNYKLLHHICQYGSDDVFEHFIEKFSKLSDSFMYAIKSGNINRVHRLEHLYGLPSEDDVKYSFQFKISQYETWYISNACSSGNLEMVQYFMTRRTTPEPDWISKKYYSSGNSIYTCPYIQDAATSGNVELLKYLFELCYKISENMYEYHNFSSPILHILLQHGLDPLMYECGDGGEKYYSFTKCIESKNMTHLLLLQQYSKKEEWNTIIRQVLENFDSIFIPLLTDAEYFQYAKDELAIDYMLYNYEITNQDWIDLYINLIHWKKDVLVEKYAKYIDLDMFFQILEKVCVTDYTRPILRRLLEQYWWLKF